jgi:hypothetical protein
MAIATLSALIIIPHAAFWIYVKRIEKNKYV